MYDFVSRGLSSITIPTYLTLIRFALIPWIVVSISSQAWTMAFVLLAIAGFTDIIDGPLARYLNQESVIGAFLDPCADKLLLGSCYISLCMLGGYSATIPLWFVLFTIISELLFVAIALYLVFVKKNHGIQPSKLGKLSGLAQILFIGWILIGRMYTIHADSLFFLLLALVVIARLYAFIDYGLGIYYSNSKSLVRP